MRGCTGESEQEYIFPPMAVAADESERVRLRRCPVHLITVDLRAMFRAYQLADGKLTHSEQERLPGPYLEAFDLYHYHHGQAAAQRAKERRK